MENNDAEGTWCRANVVGIDKINRSNLERTSFDIVYEGEPDDILSFPLILDFEHGDVLFFLFFTSFKIDIVQRNVKNIYLYFVWAFQDCLKFCNMLS